LPLIVSLIAPVKTTMLQKTPIVSFVNFL